MEAVRKDYINVRLYGCIKGVIDVPVLTDRTSEKMKTFFIMVFGYTVSYDIFLIFLAKPVEPNGISGVINL